jgi:hypothetical protein
MRIHSMSRLGIANQSSPCRSSSKDFPIFYGGVEPLQPDLDLTQALHHPQHFPHQYSGLGIEPLKFAKSSVISMHSLRDYRIYAYGDCLTHSELRPSTADELERLVQQISSCAEYYLERHDLLVRHMGNSYLSLKSRDGAAMDDLLGRSITYRISVGLRQGR